MNKIVLLGLLAIITLISGCTLSLDDVRLREAACKAERGEVIRYAHAGMTPRIYKIECKVDGAVYKVTEEGKLL